MEITAEVEGKHCSSDQALDDKKNNLSSEESVKSTPCLANAVLQQRCPEKWQLRPWGKSYGRGQKNFPEKAVFFGKFSQKPVRRFFAKPEGRKTLRRRWKNWKARIWWISVQVMRVVVIYRRRGKKLQKNCFTSKEYLGQTTFLRLILYSKALHCFSRSQIPTNFHCF